MAPAATQVPIPPRARGFVIDRESGDPLPGVVVVAVAERDENVAVPVGILVSDSAGYLSFDLTEPHEAGLTLRRLWLCPFNDSRARVDIARNCLLAGEAGLHFVLEVDARSVAKRGSPTSLASVQNPVAADWKISPHSLSTKSIATLGEDGCATPYPSNFADRDYRFYKVVRHPDLRQPTLPASGHEVSLTGQVLTPVKVDPLGSLAEGLRTSIAWGEVFEFRQRWIPLAHSLGQIAYSLALAPCESVDLAVVDWSRQDIAMRTDRITATENLLHNQYRDRNIEETITAAVDESQGGFSVLGALAGAATGLTTGGISWAITAALGASVAHSSGERNTEANSTQTLHDHVKQATSSRRSLSSTVIVQGTQEEHNALETRTITNHNHCHALTVQYYEVLRNFRLVTTFERKRPVVLIPFALVEFSWENALRFRTLLERVLLEPQLASCFDAIVRVHNCQAAYPKAVEGNGSGDDMAGGPATPVNKRAITRYELALQSGDSPTYGQVRVQLLVKGDWKQLFLKPMTNEGGTEIPKNQLLRYSITSGEAIGVERKDIEKVRVGWFENDGDDDWWLDGIEIKYQTAGATDFLRLVKEEGNPHLIKFDNAKKGVDAEGRWESDTAPPPDEDDSTNPPEDSSSKTGAEPLVHVYSLVDDECCEQTLLTHLKANVGFYNRAVWLLQDPAERRILLDAALKSYSQIRDGLDEIPLAVSGNYVAFAYDLPVLVPQTGPAISAGDNIVPQGVPPSEDIVSIPTRGLFAEAQLGHCNSCEVRDVTRFWQWEESPCEKPPSIEGITPGPHGQPTSIQPANLPASVVQVMQPPPAPDPAGLAAAMNLLGQPNIFRDMSGTQELSHLLAGLSSGAVDLAKAQQLANSVNQKMARGALGGGTAGSSGSHTAPELYDKFKVLQAMADEGLITRDKASEAVQAYVQEDSGGGSGVGGSGPLPARLLDELVMGAAGGGFGTEPTLSEARVSGEKLPTRRLSLMSKDRFFGEMSQAARDTWYSHQLGPFSKQMVESANIHKVPVQLIAAVIFAELIDIDEKDLIQEEMFVTKGSVGIAQIQIDSAIGEKLFTDITTTEQKAAYDEFLSSPLQLTSIAALIYGKFLMGPDAELRLAVNRRLRTPQQAIDAAAGFIRLHLAAASGNRAKAWASAFGFTWPGTPLSSPQDFYSYVAGVNQKEKEANLAAMTAGRHNTPSITGAASISPGTFGNALFQADSASRIAKELFDSKIFRPTP
jgi:hypothetical protein